MDTSPDTVRIPRNTAQEIIDILEEHVGDFIDAPDLGISFAREREIIRLLKSALERRTYTINELYSL